MRKRTGWWLGVALAFCLNTAFAQSTAVFNVNKIFDPADSETPAEIELSCNTGLPLVQSIFVGAETVSFVVVHFDSGELDCEISEVDAPGFRPALRPGGQCRHGALPV